MKLGSTVGLPGDLGLHLGLDLKRCLPQLFRVVVVGSGAIYYDLLECTTCRRRFRSYGEQIRDPLLDRADHSTALLRVSLSYEYLHNRAVAGADGPEMNFDDLARAFDVAEGITLEASRYLWSVCFIPGHDSSDLLKRVTLGLQTKTPTGWQTIESREM